MALVTNTTPEEIPDLTQPTTPILPPIPPTPCGEVDRLSTSSSSLSSSEKSTSPTSKMPPGIAIISRFPNSRNEDEAKGHNLADSVKRNMASRPEVEPATSSSTSTSSSSTSPKILHDFQNAGGEKSRRRQQPELPVIPANQSALNRLTDSSSVLSRSLADSSSQHLHHHHHFNHRHHHHHSHGPLQQPEPTSSSATTTTSQPDIQCNEISSSDDDASPNKGVGLLPALPARRNVLKESRLSREVSALQLDGLTGSKPLSGGRQRKRSHSANTSDAENENGVSRDASVNDSVTKSRRLRSSLGGRKALTDVELKCRQLDDRIRKMEKSVALKTEQLDQEVKQLRSTWLKSASSSHFLRSNATPKSDAMTSQKSGESR